MTQVVLLLSGITDVTDASTDTETGDDSVADTAADFNITVSRLTWL